jgi:hypothetical protein
MSTIDRIIAALKGVELTPAEALEIEHVVRSRVRIR